MMNALLYGVIQLFGNRVSENQHLFESWIDRLDTWLGQKNAASAEPFADSTIHWFKLGIVAVVLLIGGILVWWLCRVVFLAIIHKVADRSKTTVDDVLVEKHFFARIAYIVPLLFVAAALPYVLEDFSSALPLLEKVALGSVIWMVMRSVTAFLEAMFQVLQLKPAWRDKPMGSYLQLSKLIIYFVFGILLISLLAGKSPLYFLSALGAMTAIIILIFKDTILGFVASIQIAANDMVRVGDWVTMDKYGADGDVVEINLATVKVKNFDLTITTIPTYAFISDSFKNWRGMEESDGRRIKRAISINLRTIKFCSPELLERLSKYELITNYIEEKKTELSNYNQEKVTDPSELINGRHLTNVGVFRQYILEYVKSNEFIHSEMTCMVRQLPPDEKGLPIEIYAFSTDKTWGNYEAIIANIFDHILTVVPKFDLELFQNPSGSDFSSLGR